MTTTFVNAPDIEIEITRATRSRIEQPDWNNLEFGKYISDHMLVADYANGKWDNVRIEPFGEIKISPVILGLHYGQTAFEGMKAFRLANGKVSLFRPLKHFTRFNKTLQRMSMPEIPEEIFLNGIAKLLEIDSDWVPRREDSSLYLRPLMFATEARLGVKVSQQYKFMVMSSPAGPYFVKPLKTKVELQYTRAAEGGTGFAKCGGNYGGAFYPSQLARQQGYDQVLWTDSKEHKYFDEAGTMNLMFVMDNVLITPPLSTAILEGITRDSMLQLAEDAGIKTEVRKISVKEVEEALDSGKLTEAFGTGTAAVVVPIKTIGFKGVDKDLPDQKPNSIMSRLRDELLNIRIGKIPDRHNWNFIIE